MPILQHNPFVSVRLSAHEVYSINSQVALLRIHRMRRRMYAKTRFISITPISFHEYITTKSIPITWGTQS